MQLWQPDTTGSVFLTDGTEPRLISGIDDCSRYCVHTITALTGSCPLASRFCRKAYLPRLSQ